MNKIQENKDSGYSWLPYIPKVTETSINGETVWYANKWKNLLLKIKHFFIKPKYLKIHIYKKVGSKYSLCDGKCQFTK